MRAAARAIRMKRPQSNQRGIENVTPASGTTREEARLNRTSVGLKIRYFILDHTDRAAPQSNQRGIENLTKIH